MPKKSVKRYIRKNKKNTRKPKIGGTEAHKKTKKPPDYIFTLIDRLKVETPRKIGYASDDEPDSENEELRNKTYTELKDRASKALQARPDNLLKFKAFLEDDVDVNKTKCKKSEERSHGYTPLLYAIEEEHDDDVIKILLQREDIDVNKSRKTSTLEYTPLSRAIFKGRTSIVRILLQNNKIDVNKPAPVTPYFYYETPIYTAATRKQKEIVGMLAQHPNIDLDTPIKKAREEKKTDIVDALTIHLIKKNIKSQNNAKLLQLPEGIGEHIAKYGGKKNNTAWNVYFVDT